MKKKIKEIKRTNITKNKSNPKISIIIPIYNAEEYLKECLDSIINQTLKEIEIICINDGSTDNSLNIIEGYGKKDTRIKIIDQNNHGVGYSRNVGIRVARGEFLSFVDPDDYYPDKEILSKLYDTAIQQKVNICGGGLIYYNNQNHISTESQKSEEHFSRNGILEYKDYQFDYGFQRYIYKTSLIKNNNIYFPEYKRYQDPPFFCQAMNTAKKFYGITQYSYVYRCNQQKLKWTEEKVFDLLQGLRDNLVYAQKKQLQNLYELTLNRIKKDFKLPILEITSNRIQDIRQEIMQICIDNAKRKYKPSEAKVSVILPIYNAEKYLRECLDSVINQSLKEIEIICVNDGSTDNSLDIIKEYATKDSRIFYIDKPNAGYGQTMNCGIEIATGEYIGIVEPDDFIDLKMYETLYNKAQETGVDFVKGDTYFWWSKNNQKKYSNCITDKSLYNSVRNDLYNIGLIVGAITNCAGIYKRSFINKYAIKYQETPGASFQDQGFYYQVIFNAQSGYYINIPFYYYRQDNSSSSVNSKKTVECIFNEYHFIKSKLSQIKDKEKFYPLYYTKMINSYLWNLSRVEEDAWTEINQKIAEEIKQEYASGNLNSSIIDSKTWNKIKPYITGTQTIPVILSADNNYAPYMYITMFSMLENAKKTTSYDYYLLVPSSFDNKNKKMIMKLKENYNCDIHFIDMKNSFSDLKQMIAHITSPTYYRLLAADILPNYYDRCLYLDVDVCVCQDLSELYSIDLGNNYVAGVKAAGYHFVPQKHCQRLNLPNIDHYINAGVLVMNLKQIRQDKMTEKFVKLSKNNYETVDQDVLNVACFGRIKTLPLKYNFMQQYETLNLWQSCISKKIYNPEEIGEAKNSPVIIHYADKIKPWNDISVYMAEHWWKYADKAHISKINKKIEYKKLLQKWFLKYNKHELNLDYPTTFNEKIQWMKLYASTPIKTVLADKYLVRQWIKDTIGAEYLIPILGVYDKYEDINFDTLPEQFVIKCNHGCGYNIIVKDKNELDKEATKQKLNKWMSENFAFKCGFELHYKNIKPKIIIEKYMEDESGELQDYKFMCFNGKTKLILLDSNRYSGHKRNVYNENWELQNFSDFPNNPHKIAKPSNLEKLKELAHILSKEFNFARIDFYIVNGSIYFGEITFTPASGNLKFPHSIDKELGSLIKLPSKAYDIDTGKYYKLKRISRLRNWLNNKLLKYKTKKELHKTVLTQLKQYRLDIKNEGGADNRIEISSNKSCRISQPAWFSNAKGIGQVVEGYDKNNLLRIKAIKSGKLILSFKAPDKKIDNKRIPFWIDYKSIKINDQEILNAPISVWHDKPYNYEMNVKNGDVIYITFETQYHQYPKWELQNIIFALNWNNMNVLKKLRKIRKAIAKKIKPKKASKIFCIEQKGCKKTIKLFGFKISFVNKHQELVEQLKQYNRTMIKQDEHIQYLYNQLENIKQQTEIIEKRLNIIIKTHGNKCTTKNAE